MNSKTINKILLFLLALQALVNLIGVLGPELGFDALWHHLPLAKLFLKNRSLSPIKGNLLYWSGLPRFIQIIYALALKLWDERLAKLLHWLAGIISSYLIYKIAHQKLSKTAALIASTLFYTTLLVGWLSTTAYIDLFVCLFFLLALNSERKITKVISLIFLGATKVTAVPLNFAVTWFPWSLLGLLPFLILNYLKTQNPFYPFLENFNLSREWFFNGFSFWFSRPLRIFLDPVFRVGPVLLLLIIFYFKKINWKTILKPLFITFIFWWLGPGTSYGRFALPFLSLLSITVSSLFNKKTYFLALTLVLLQGLSGIGLRFYFNQKYLPVIFKTQTKQEFLVNNLKFHFGDFCDCDGWFEKNLKPTDKVLIYNIHNLYYVNFPYDHESWASEDQNYTHILVGDNADLPSKYGQLPLIYQNPTTRVKLYKVP